MKESIERAEEELKRADHLVYVSLKYTRTVDVIKNIIERLINAFDCGIETLLDYAKKKKKIQQKPNLTTQRYSAIKKLFKDDEEMMKLIELYPLLKKINKAEFKREREYRRHVTMVVEVEGEVRGIDIDLMYKYFEKAKEFIALVKEKTG